jgi:hypothetical protein
MIQEIARRLPSTERSLRSVGLMRVSQAYGGRQVAAAFVFGALLGAGIALYIWPPAERVFGPRARVRDDGRDAAMQEH